MSSGRDFLRVRHSSIAIFPFDSAHGREPVERQSSILYDTIFMCIRRPAGQRARSPCFRVHAVPGGCLYVLCFHHVIPAADKIGTFIVETHPQKSSPPGGVYRCLPFFHFHSTARAFGYFLIVHSFLPKKENQTPQAMPGDLVPIVCCLTPNDLMLPAKYLPAG